MNCKTILKRLLVTILTIGVLMSIMPLKEVRADVYCTLETPTVYSGGINTGRGNVILTFNQVLKATSYYLIIEGTGSTAAAKTYNLTDQLSFNDTIYSWDSQNRNIFNGYSGFPDSSNVLFGYSNGSYDICIEARDNTDNVIIRSNKQTITMPDSTKPNYVSIPTVNVENPHDGSGKISLEVIFDQTTDLPTINPSGINYYKLKLYNKISNTYTEIASINISYNSNIAKYSYQFSDIPDNRIYVATVRAYDNNGNYTGESQSSERSVGNNSPPSAPQNLKISPDTTTNKKTATITWTPYNDSTIKIGYSLSETGPYIYPASGTEGQLTIDTSGFAEGDTNIYIIATYEYFNLSSTPLSVTFKKDSINSYMSFTIVDTVLISYDGTAADVIVPDYITKIDHHAFYNCAFVRSIILPESINEIGENAFLGCSGLVSINIPDNVRKIGGGAFSGCSSLQSIVIPYNITTIEAYLFNSCANLTSISLPESIIHIKDGAFSNCINLVNIDIPVNVTSIGIQAFKNCSKLKQVSIPEGVSIVNNNLFENCNSLTTVSIPSTVTEIGNYCFKCCANLTNINFPSNIVKIGYGAFYECDSLKNIEIPNGITIINSSTFFGCEQLSSVILPNTITLISTSAFYNCSNLTSSFIPVNVTSIGIDAFKNCSKLIIYCPIDSYAQSYAIANNIPYINASSPVSSIAMASSPTKIIYNYGESLSLEGASITAVFEDQFINTLDITDAMINSYDPYKVGIQTITVSYSGKTTSFDVTVINNVDSISIQFSPTKINYKYGEAIDLSGAQIKITYANASTQIIAITSDMISGYNANQLGTQTITVTYEGKTTSFDLTVNNFVSSISMVSSPTKINYLYGEAIDVTGAQIKVTYADATTATLAVTADMISGYDPNKIGTQTVTVTYEGKTTTFEVTVKLNTYNVTFQSQGGSSVAGTTAVHGNKLTAPAAPNKRGYTFGGWFKEAGCINAWNFNTDTVTGNVTLYAKWNNITPGVIYSGHVQNIGWMAPVSDGAMCGTSGMSYRVEALKINLQNAPAGLTIKYRVHVQNIGWMGWVSNGTMAGTSGQSLRVEAIQIILEGTDADKYSVQYQTHVQNIGWQGWVSDGAVAGTSGQSLRVEAIRIKIVDKAPVTPPAEPPVVPPVVPSASSVVYQGHVQNIGWQAPVADGAICGTSGMSYRVEAFNIHLENVPAGMSVKYKVHVQNIGWMDWVRNGFNAGTTGQSLRVEAIQIMLEGTDADKYSIIYQAHVQNIGWQPWVSDGAVAGTSGQSLRIEAIRIRLVKK